MRNSILSQIIVYVALLISIGCFTSCNEIQNEINPRRNTIILDTTGKQIEQGIQGETGPKGEPGPSVATSYSFTVTSDNWTETDTGYLTMIMVPGITSDIEASGMVLVYLRNTSNTAWVALPNSFGTSVGEERRYFFTYTTGLVNIYYEDSTTPTPFIPSIRIFRVVTLPGTEGRLSSGYDYSNYEGIRNTFNLLER